MSDNKCACSDSCKCKTGFNDELGKLEVLTDLVEFAKQQKAKKSPHTNGWANSDTLIKWQTAIGSLRNIIPKCALELFDAGRKNHGHREGCKCMLCEEKRNN